MKILQLVACLCLAAVTSGCLPERILWSPDGSRAVIFASDHVYLSDPNGVLTDAGAMKAPRAVAWFADSSQIAYTTETIAHEWKDVESALTEHEKTWITESAEAFRVDILANYREDLAHLKSTQDRSDQQLQLMKMYLRDRHPEDIAEKLGPKWQDFVDASWNITTLRTANITADGVQANPAIIGSIDQIVCIRINRQSKIIAYALKKRDNSRMGTISLCAVASNGSGAPSQVATNTGWHFDWTSDGTSLVYAISSDGASNQLRLGTISRRQICGTDGWLLKDFKETNELAAIYFSHFMKIHCLKNGRIFFSGIEGYLPATTKDMPTRGSIFALDPARYATIIRVLPDQIQAAVPTRLDLFSVSPDQTRLCIPGNKGEVSIVTLSNAKVQHLVHARNTQMTNTTNNLETKLTVVPTWRTGHDLCLMVPPGSPYGSPNRAEIVLYAGSDKFRCISKDWPDSLIESLSKNP